MPGRAEESVDCRLFSYRANQRTSEYNIGISVKQLVYGVQSVRVILADEFCNNSEFTIAIVKCDSRRIVLICYVLCNPGTVIMRGYADGDIAMATVIIIRKC